MCAHKEAEEERKMEGQSQYRWVDGSLREKISF